MEHIYKKGESKNTLLLLHGTGGNEHDLIPLREMIDPKANILSVRGQILENGMPRFFKRLQEGVFDEKDLIFRTHELKNFIDEASHTYGFDKDHIIAFGYSNGANIASSLLFHYNHVFKAAFLSHPMIPLRGIVLPNLKNVNIFIGACSNDPLTTIEQTYELKQMYEKANADVDLYIGSHGHRLSQDELDSAIKWYNQIISYEH